MKKFIMLTLIALLIPVFRVKADSGGYIVKFKEGYSPCQDEYKFEEISRSRNLYHVDDLEHLKSIEKYIEYYEPNKKVELIEGFETASLNSIANDAMYSEQWQLQMINADSAWNIETYGNDIRVAVIDSGCSVHDDLKDNVLDGKNYFDNSTDVTDDIGHGTHVSGIIAVQMNDIGIVGVAPKAKIVPLKCFRIEDDQTLAMIIKAIDDAVNVYHCQIINMSWGMPGGNKALEEVINDAYEKGVIMIASVGNKGSTLLYYPAAYDSVIGVGSVTKSKAKSSFSQYNSSVFVVASGQDVKSTYNNGDYYSLRGTSQAVPFVSGLAAIALSADENLTVDRFKQLLIDTSEDLGDSGYDTKFGYGLVNTEKLLDVLLAENPCYVSPINVKDDKAYVYIKNNSPDTLEAVSIFSKYNNNLFSGITQSSISLLVGEDRMVNIDYNGEKLSHFLWNDINGIKPMANKKTKEMSE